jgi:hypothetical protein
MGRGFFGEKKPLKATKSICRDLTNIWIIRYFIIMYGFGRKTAKMTEKALFWVHYFQIVLYPPPPPPIQIKGFALRYPHSLGYVRASTSATSLRSSITKKKEKVKKQDRISSYFLQHPILSIQSLKTNKGAKHENKIFYRNGTHRHYHRHSHRL